MMEQSVMDVASLWTNDFYSNQTKVYSICTVSSSGILNE